MLFTRRNAPRHPCDRRSHFLALATTAATFLATAQAEVQQAASTLFEDKHHFVHQVRVIDIESGDKTSIGSGFRVSAHGHIATNFHVVSLVVHQPEKYRLELDTDSGRTMAASIGAIDVVNDLALVTVDGPGEGHFEAFASSVRQGERIYSMGNPRDLGMTIIEGTYNGLVKTSRFERLLFSGSLNEGMSGGPAFNAHGQIVGVNVSTGGEQIGFLVPAHHLEDLIERALEQPLPQQWKAVIARDLINEQDAYFQRRLAEDWQVEAFGELLLPREISPNMKCWGHNIDDEESDVAYDAFHQHCRSEEYLFIKSGFYTANFSYDYEWITAKGLNPLQFYSAVESRFTHATTDNVDDEDDVTDYGCVTDFVEIDGTSWKSSICLRRYREYDGLHDASLVMASLLNGGRAAVIRMAAAGIERQNAFEMFRKLMKSARWQR